MMFKVCLLHSDYDKSFFRFPTIEATVTDSRRHEVKRIRLFQKHTYSLNHDPHHISLYKEQGGLMRNYKKQLFLDFSFFPFTVDLVNSIKREWHRNF